MSKAKAKPLNRDGNYIYIGHFNLGFESVQVLGCTKEKGGSFSTGTTDKLHKDEKQGMARMLIGFDYSSFWHVQDVLMHEALEFAMVRLYLRFECSEAMSRSMANYNFVMNHEQFAEVSTRASWFMWHAITPLRAAYALHLKAEREVKKAEKEKAKAAPEPEAPPAG